MKSDEDIAREIQKRIDELDMKAYHEANETSYAELDDDGNVVVVNP